LGNFFFNRSRYLISLSLFHSAQLCLSFSAGLISNIIFAHVSFPSSAPFSEILASRFLRSYTLHS
jgi:hypothetical protein